MYSYCVPMRKHFDKHKNTLHILFPPPVRQMVSLNQVIRERRENTGKEMNEIFIGAQIYAFLKVCRQEKLYPCPINFRQFCNNKYLHLWNSFNLKTEIGWEKKVTGFGVCTACMKGCAVRGPTSFNPLFLINIFWYLSHQVEQLFIAL